MSAACGDEKVSGRPQHRTRQGKLCGDLSDLMYARNLLKQLMKVVVRSGADLDQNVARPGDGVNLQYVWNGSESSDHLIVPALGDRQIGERPDWKTRGCQGEVGSVAENHPFPLHPLKPTMHRTAGQTKKPGQV